MSDSKWYAIFQLLYFIGFGGIIGTFGGILVVTLMGVTHSDLTLLQIMISVLQMCVFFLSFLLGWIGLQIHDGARRNEV